MSRAYKIGNIYSRVEGLLLKNHIKEKDKPIWFDVYKRFPPKYEPNFNRVEPDMEVKKIFYREDTLRAKIHNAYSDRLGVFIFEDSRDSFSQSLLKSCLEYVSEGMSEDEAIKKLEVKLQSNTEENSTFDPPVQTTPKVQKTV